MRTRNVALTLFSVTLCVARAVGAQSSTVRFEVRDGTTSQALPGAVVTAQSANGAAPSRALTNDRGIVTIQRSDARTSVRIVRMGYRPWERQIAASDSEPVIVAMVRLPTLLAEVVTISQTNCPVSPLAERAFAVWQQAQAALLAAVVARESSPSNQLRYVIERRMSGLTDSVVDMRVDAESGEGAGASFGAALTADEFVRVGFVDRGVNRRRYYGPDAEVLLSDEFFKAYCIALAPPNQMRPAEVGLRFAPARRSSQRIDIRGTLWIDTTARTLRDIEFDYLGLDEAFTTARPGGSLSFCEMRNGVVLVDGWTIRTLSGMVDTLWATPTVSVPRFRPMTKEFEGLLVRAEWPALTWEAPLARIDVTLRRPNGAPAVGVRVELSNTPHNDRSAADGTVKFESLAPGPYRLVAKDSTLAPIGWSIPLIEQLRIARDERLTLSASVPSVREYTRARCAALHQDATDDGVVVLGRVLRVDSAGGAVSVDQATLSFAVEDDREYEPVRLRVVTGSDGLFQVCLPNTAQARRLRVIATRSVGGPRIAEVIVNLTSPTVVVPVIISNTRKK